MENTQLFIDLVPRSAWLSNLRSELTSAEWDLVRKKTYRQAGFVCQACGGQGPKHPVECHERWSFSTAEAVQTLAGLVALCPACHEATHYGLARVRGREAFARAQLLRVNAWTVAQLNAHVNEAMATYRRRSEIHWTLDTRWLLDYVALSDATKESILAHAAKLRASPIAGGQ